MATDFGESKLCVRCGLDKPIEEFATNTARTDGLLRLARRIITMNDLRRLQRAIDYLNHAN
jgi:hypothetical protein